MKLSSLCCSPVPANRLIKTRTWNRKTNQNTPAAVTTAVALTMKKKRKIGVTSGQRFERTRMSTEENGEKKKEKREAPLSPLGQRCPVTAGSWCPLATAAERTRWLLCIVSALIVEISIFDGDNFHFRRMLERQKPKWFPAIFFKNKISSLSLTAR